jgi:hypothetical protein
VRAEKVRRKHRSDEPRYDKREQHLHRDCDAELFEERPAMPPMKLTGANTATMARLMAITARPISSAASIAA